jgi:hypothetical protein
MLLLKLAGFWLLPPRDFSQQMRVTLWITTAIHLDTPKVILLKNPLRCFCFLGLRSFADEP